MVSLLFTSSRGGTHGDRGAPEEGAERGQAAANYGSRCEQHLHHAGTLTRKDDDGREHECREQVRVPRERERATAHDVEAFLDDDGMHRGDHTARDAEADAGAGDGCTVEEDTNEEAGGDEPAREEDVERGPCVQVRQRGEHGERQDHAPCDLVEGRVDIFEGVVREAAGPSADAQREARYKQPEANDREADGGSKALDDTSVDLERDRDQTSKVACEEEGDGDDELGEQEEQWGCRRVQHPLVSAQDTSSIQSTDN
jgi:hypothetical protein